jgi:hypothetical protein
MPPAIKPCVLQMILCDEVVSNPRKPGTLDVNGLVWLVRWPAGGTVPARLDRLVALLILTDGRGAGRGRIRCLNEETGMPIFGSADVPISFEGKDPSLPYGVRIGLRNCRFPVPGAYTVQFLFEDEVLCQQTLLVR